ncbi:hypothetical protein WJX81_006888 [Elliptochloris bilobata]|uniref:NAD(P)-binding domain-containing protein n=1 Tax=Elliptochloris bilobata TaxID=381761 RepID=A0AAW1RZR8_9CHLO
MGKRAVVVGATGAVGSALVSQLLASPAWAHVTTVGRRAGPPPPSDLAHKLAQTVVNMDALVAEGAPAFAGADVAFCTLGTKRRIAGSAEGYIKVDLTYVAEAAKAAKAAGVRHFSLVTSKGASTWLPASHFVGLHPLLYLHTKGRAEEAVKAQGFERVSILRPGVLQRTAAAPAGGLLPSIKVADVARAMVADAERPADKAVGVLEMGAIQALAKVQAAKGA